MDAQVTIRAAALGDLQTINDIYNHYVLHSTTTYQLEPETMAARQAWFTSRGPAHPVIVAEAQGAVVGWGSLSRYHPRAAYARTIENSVYVAPAMHRQGIGSALLRRLIELAREQGHHTIIAAIDADQPPSIGIHAKFGFVEVGRMRQLGWKFEKWLDVVYMQLML
jgi:phosphinothricin acetyltransferase